MSKSRSIADQIAFGISATLSPFVVFSILVGVIAYLESRTLTEFLTWSVITIGFSIIIPGLFIVYRVSKGAITDFHIMKRKQRRGVFVFGLASSLIAVLLLWLVQASPLFLGLALAVFANTLVAAVITLVWKISIHSWVLAGSIVTWTLIAHETRIWWLLVLVPVMIWARFRRKRHSLAQGVAGAIIGGSLAVISIKLLLSLVVAT